MGINRITFFEIILTKNSIINDFKNSLRASRPRKKNYFSIYSICD